MLFLIFGYILFVCRIFIISLNKVVNLEKFVGLLDIWLILVVFV